MSEQPPGGHPATMVQVSGLTKRFGRGDAAVTALDGVELSVPRGGLVALTGRSGSGKTTLLHCIGGLERPDEGSVVVDGTEVTGLDEDGLLALRRDHVGFVFQTFALVPILTARENVGVPLRLSRTPAAEREQQVERLLRLVGLADHAEQRPGELSGGQQQRVAVARALAGRPSLLLADEPTGQLDSATGRAVMELLRAIVASEGVTAVVATHDPGLIDVADAVHELRDGRLVDPAAATPV
ncbi:ABC transporter ATP-binding protein [Nocardioides sp. HDW12B]|uniref:ABC transporter ATP-binding protein n=1 Tax=Nocardioides sp. HDW12B TaxID=2714939 RepID=UPI001407869C|nr:ABC transporter ATP-binding protein [Nocardioides sp. HDW12B]QIK65936.1 ABC transporter ATP-binding protein [Nocardioides sp. HDW12B]